MRTPIEPNYQRDIDRLISYYRRAIRRTVGALDALDLHVEDARDRREIARQIESILREVDKEAKEWVEENIPKAYREGQASTLISIGEATTLAGAAETISKSRLNRQFIEAMIDDTFDDLLQMTNNTRRKVKQTIREVVAEQMRSKATDNLGRKTMTREIVKDFRKKLGDSAEFAIRDRANRPWRIEDYVDVVVQTKLQQAHIEGVKNEAIERGAYYGIISSHGATDACRYHEGRIAKLVPGAPGNYPTVEQLRATNQIFHPRCRHSIRSLRDPGLLPKSVRDKADKQSEMGDRAIASGKRNPKDIE